MMALVYRPIGTGAGTTVTPTGLLDRCGNGLGAVLPPVFGVGPGREAGSAFGAGAGVGTGGGAR